MARILAGLALLLFFGSFLYGAHAYLIQRMILDLGLSAGLERTLVVSVIALGATLILQPIAERTLRPQHGRFISWPASLWMGSAFLALLLLLASDLALWLGERVAYAAGGEAASDGAGMARVRAAGVLLVAGVASAVALRSGLRPPELRRVELRLADWPRALDGFRIAQITDIHIGPILDRRFARSLVDRVNALDADLVAVTGDLVDGSVGKLAAEVAPFADLRGRHGVFFVTGNHDHYSGAESWAEHVVSLGMTVLRNRHEVIGVGGAALVVAGVDDHRANMIPGQGGEDLEAALSGRPSDAPVLLLAHDPSTFKRASGMGISLQLSGHTHGGQIWPFSALVRLAIPFVAGVYRRAGATLYVSRGTGFWGPPMRLRAPAEITEIVLRSDSPG